jgi:hypothetical protein
MGWFDDAVKSVTKPFKDVVKSIPIVSDVAKFTDKTISNVARETGKFGGDVFREAKGVTDAGAGFLASEGLNIATVGLSEQFGLGDKIRGQFGGNKDLVKVSSIANGIGAKARQTGFAIGTAGLLKEQTAGLMGGAPAGRSPAGAVTNNIIQGDNVEDDFWSNLGNIGLDYLNTNVLNNGGGKDRNVPVAQPTYQNFPTAQPMLAQAGAIDQKTMLMIGGGLVLVLLLVKR